MLGVVTNKFCYRLANVHHAIRVVHQFDVARVPTNKALRGIDHTDTLRNILQCRLGQLAIETHCVRCLVKKQNDVTNFHTCLAKGGRNHHTCGCRTDCPGQEALSELQQAPVRQQGWRDIQPFGYREILE